MYCLFTDETNSQASENVTFFVYGGLFFHTDAIPDLDAGVREIRKKYGFTPIDVLKFNTNSRPQSVSVENHRSAKNDVLELCAAHDCRFIAYVVHHKIAEKKESRKSILMLQIM